MKPETTPLKDFTTNFVAWGIAGTAFGLILAEFTSKAYLPLALVCGLSFGAIAGLIRRSKWTL